MTKKTISSKTVLLMSLATVLLVALGVFIGVQWQKLGDVGVASDGTNAVQQPYTPDTCEGDTFADYDKDGKKYCRKYTLTQIADPTNGDPGSVLMNQNSDMFVVHASYKDEPEQDTYDIKRLDTKTDIMSNYASVPADGLTAIKVSPNNVLYSFKTNTTLTIPQTTVSVDIKKFNTTTKQFEEYITVDGEDTGFLSENNLAAHAYIDSNENIYLVSGFPFYYFQGTSFPTRNDFAIVDKDKNVRVVKVSENDKVRVLDIDIAKDNTTYVTYVDATTPENYIFGVKKTTPQGSLTDYGTPILANAEELGSTYMDGAWSQLGLDNSITIMIKMPVAFLRNHIRITETQSKVISMSNFIEEHYLGEDNYPSYPSSFDYQSDSSFFTGIFTEEKGHLLRFSKDNEFKEIANLSSIFQHTENKYYLAEYNYIGTEYKQSIYKLELESKDTEPEPTTSCVDFETLTSTGNAPKDQLKIAKQFADKGFTFSLTKTKANQSCPKQPQIAIKGGKRTAFVGYGAGTQRNDNPDPSETKLGNYFLTDDGTISKSACQLNVAVLDGFRSNRVEFDIIDVDYRQSNKAERFNIAIFGANNKKLKTIKTPKIDEPSKSYHVVLEAEEPIYSFRVIPIGTVSNWGVAYDNFCSVK